MTRLGLLLLLIAATANSLIAQQAAPKFEVASVKPLEPGSTGYAIGPPVNGTVRYRGAQLRRLVSYAFGLDPMAAATTSCPRADRTGLTGTCSRYRPEARPT